MPSTTETSADLGGSKGDQPENASGTPGGVAAGASGGLADQSLPVNSYRNAAPHLRRPFAVEAIKWKVQTGKLIVPHIDARLAIERLNLVCPHLWSDAYEMVPGTKVLRCALTIDGITRSDVGSGWEGKGLFSDAFKRSCVKFGVGVSLYALPKVFLDPSKGQLEETGAKDKKGKPIYRLTDKGIENLRAAYKGWLERTGIPQFGDVLAHGDVLDAIGDVEASAAPEPTSTETAEPAPLTDDRATELVTEAETAYANLPKSAKTSKGLTAAAFRRALEGARTSHADLEALVEDVRRRGAEASDA